MCGVVCGDGMQVYCDGIDVCCDVYGDICGDVCGGVCGQEIEVCGDGIDVCGLLLLLSCPSVAIHRLGVVKIAP